MVSRGGGFDEDLVGGGEEEVAEYVVLAEFGDGAAQDDVEAVGFPGVLVEAGDGAAQAFRIGGGVGGEDTGAHGLVTEEAGLLGHHEMLGAAVGLTVDSEFDRPPLAEHPLAHLVTRGARMTPEEQKLRSSPVRHLSCQLRPVHVARP